MRYALIVIFVAMVSRPAAAALDAAEHPYLLFQKADIPALREKVKTDPVAVEAFAGLG